MSDPIQAVYSTAENFKQPILSYDDKTKLYTLLVDYTFEWGSAFARMRLTRVAPYEYDKASVPRLAQALARSDGPWDGPSLLHDNLYQYQGKFNKDFYYEIYSQYTNFKWIKSSRPWNRHQADELLAMAGKCAGAGSFKAWLYKAAVQIYPPNWFKGF